jgi:hypothetical protein
MKAQQITLIAVAVIVAGVLGDYFFFHSGQPVRTSLKLDQAVGQVAAEETLKLLQRGQIVVITEDTKGLLNHAADLQVESFKETLNKQNQVAIVAIEKVLKEPLSPTQKPGAMGLAIRLSKDQLFDIVQAHPEIAGVVSFIGFPSLETEEAASLKTKPLKYVIIFNSSFGIDFDRLDAQQIVNLAIVARNYPLEDGGKTRLTAREQFDQCYGVIEPGSTN